MVLSAQYMLDCADMAWVIVGLGNPGVDYEGTRHNTGRMAVESFARAMEMNGFREEKKKKATIGSGLVGKTAVALILPDTYMNKSGDAVGKFVKSQKAAERLIVVYDDLDLPLGVMKVSFDRGSGGHRGVESIIRAVKTKKFSRVRIGISPTTASGNIRKPSGEKEVNDFILATFKPAELTELKKIFKRASEAMDTIVREGVQVAMNKCN